MKNLIKLAGGALCAISLAACQGIPDDVTVADYCADPRNAAEDVCRLNVEIAGQQTALADTNLKLNEARALADQAVDMSNRTRNTAEDALARANAAYARADAALLDQLTCETRVIQKTDIGTCRPGYTLMSCTQTRYTYAAGGPSILREIDDEQCRFHDRVLEMNVRCCTTAAAAAADADATPVPTTTSATN